MKYVHWLELGGIKVIDENEKKQWRQIKGYLEKYPESNATVYLKDTGDVFKRFVKLECSQSYNDLDLDCNSMLNGSIRHLDHKPNSNEISETRLEHFIKVMR